MRATAGLFHAPWGRMVGMNEVPATPEYSLGQRVRVVLNEHNRTPHEGEIYLSVWHFKLERYHYWIVEGGKRISKRYAASDLEPVENG